MNKLLNTFTKFSRFIPNFEINNFMRVFKIIWFKTFFFKEYDLTECTWAVDRIQNGPPKMVKIKNYLIHIQKDH